ncbi:MAG: hypothetical protein AB8G15_10620 [Saprospiraceae bacterium]
MMQPATYEKAKKIGTTILVQMLPVMIGVYLGFAMNNFGERQKLEKQSNTYKEMLKNEIRENLASVENVNSYHIQLTNKFSEILEAENMKEKFGSMQFRGFKPGFVNNSAYNTGIQTGIIQEFDLKLIQSLNRLYTLQGKYNRFNENLINSYISNKFPETNSEIRSLLISSSMSMTDILIYEKELRSFYQEILKAL